MTPLNPFQLVVIVAEPVLEPRLTAELLQLGATGFTVVEGRGTGSRGSHATELPGDTVRIETVVPPVFADRIMAHLADHYFAHYGVIAYTHDVRVARTGKYV